MEAVLFNIRNNRSAKHSELCLKLQVNVILLQYLLNVLELAVVRALGLTVTYWTRLIKSFQFPDRLLRTYLHLDRKNIA